MKFPAMVQLYVQLCLLFLGEALQPGWAVLCWAVLGCVGLCWAVLGCAGLHCTKCKIPSPLAPREQSFTQWTSCGKASLESGREAQLNTSLALSQHGVRIPSAASPARVLLLFLSVPRLWELHPAAAKHPG